MKFRPGSVGNEWTWQLREDDSIVITIAGVRFSTVCGAVLQQRSIPAIRPTVLPTRPCQAIISAQAQISSDGAGGGC